MVRPLLLSTIQELRKEFLFGSGSGEKSGIGLLVDTYEIDLSLHIDYIEQEFWGSITSQIEWFEFFCYLWNSDFRNSSYYYAYSYLHGRFSVPPNIMIFQQIDSVSFNAAGFPFQF